MRSSSYLAAVKTAFLFTFFAMSCVIAPPVVHANVIINHLGIFGHGNPDARQEIDAVAKPVPVTPEPEGSPGDSVELGIGGNDDPRIKPSTFVPAKTFRLLTETHTAETHSSDVLFTDLPQTVSGINSLADVPLDPVSVPEPGTLGLLAAAFVAMGVTRWKV